MSTTFVVLCKIIFYELLKVGRVMDNEQKNATEIYPLLNRDHQLKLERALIELLVAQELERIEQSHRSCADFQ